ncbi:jg10202 [Pararge aegeria aegeria]|uniref:Jg10202 protein n=1 Tax=Pararge aegeria aegeria TaxID=348720 RepID=A0A8S4SPU5_9NEOP|nr:jg10202 [Pararge aegeria aegeria]
MGRQHTFVVTLRRESRDTNWGLRLVGGADLATPLIVTRVTPGSPASRDLVRGDIIAKIDPYDARDLRHEDAQNLFKNAPNQIKLVVQRARPSSHLYTLPRSTSYSFVGRSPTPTFYRLYEEGDREGPRTQLAARSPAQNAVPPPFRTPSPLPTTAWRGPESLPRTTPVPPQQYPQQYPQQVEGEYRTLLISPSSNRNDEAIDESIQSQRSPLRQRSRRLKKLSLSKSKMCSSVTLVDPLRSESPLFYKGEGVSPAMEQKEADDDDNYE